MPTDTQVLIGVLAALGCILVTGVLTALATRVRLLTQRHDLLVQARGRRQAYLHTLAQRRDREPR